jgi:hypothetical protein
VKTTSERKLVTRREFLKATAAGTAGAALVATTGLALASGKQEKTGPVTRVVLVRDKAVFSEEEGLNKAVIEQMLDDAVASLLKTEHPREAWGQMAGPTDVVGVKSNAWHLLPTPREVENAVISRLMREGVKEKNIAVGDKRVLRDKVFERSTVLLNLCTLRTHFWSGTGGCIKNYIMFVKKPWAYHDDQCADLGAIWNLKHVTGKTRLNVLCAFTPLFWGRGPHHFDRRYIWDYGGMIIGTDPVAVDAVGVRLLQAKRLEFFGEDRPLDTTPKHVVVADKRHGLGTSDLSKIELVKLGWEEDVLI